MLDGNGCCISDSDYFLAGFGVIFATIMRFIILMRLALITASTHNHASRMVSLILVLIPARVALCSVVSLLSCA